MLSAFLHATALAARRASPRDVLFIDASTVKAQYDRAIAAGHGDDSWTSLIEMIKKQSE